MAACDLTIKFPSEKARRHFAEWLDGAGEQSYWDWMAEQEREEREDITVTFEYHEVVRPDLPETDPRRYGEYLKDGVIHTKVKPRHKKERSR